MLTGNVPNLEELEQKSAMVAEDSWGGDVEEVLIEIETAAESCAMFLSALSPNIVEETPRQTWYAFFDSIPRSILYDVCQSDKLPETFQNTLLHHPDSNVRDALAESETLPETIMEKLAQDDNATVRGTVAYNMKTPPRILGEFSAKDKHKEVRYAAALNSNTPIEKLEEMSQFDTDETVRRVAYGTLVKEIYN